ncbi:MAG: hypothetical protein LUE99_01975 [Bacteroides sp.]|nr:hypothetical protein [Bacteroides sp.]
MIFPISFCLGAGTVFGINKSEDGYWKLDLLIYIIIVAVSLLVSSFTYDYSYDGIAYHQDCILQLKEGWNPFYVHHATGARHEMWVNHYARGLETIQATVYAMTNEIESGKAINIILVISSYCFMNYFFKSVYSEWKRKKRLFYTAIFTFSPVVVAQWFTYYIDFSTYSLLLILLATLIQIRGKNIFISRSMYISCYIFVLSNKVQCSFLDGFYYILFLYILFVCKKNTA